MSAAIGAYLQDLYVMRRAVGVYERIIRRFTAQDTDYQLLLSTFAEGLYTEMDFRNEALNMQRMTMLMEQSEFGSKDVIIPQPVMERTTRLVMACTHACRVGHDGIAPDKGGCPTCDTVRVTILFTHTRYREVVSVVTKKIWAC